MRQRIIFGVGYILFLYELLGYARVEDVRGACECTRGMYEGLFSPLNSTKENLNLNSTAFLLSVSTAKFSFDSKIQFRQLNSLSTVKFRDERLMYFTSSTLWFCILHHLLERLLEFHSG
jgi:hypothetical protein